MVYTLRQDTLFERHKADERADEPLLSSAFRQLDDYMDLGEYDSAQLCLNDIEYHAPYQKPSLTSYFLTSRQAEVFYYNNLHELGLQQSNRALSIADSLHDPNLKADAYNFIGLFYLSRNSVQQAISSFKNGLKYVRTPPYDARYPEMTNPHHICGNLAEAFEKSGEVDSALHYSRMSLVLAERIKSHRGMALANLSIGQSLLLKGSPTAADTYLERARRLAQQHTENDIELNAYAGLAESALANREKNRALAWLEAGMTLLQENAELNDFFSLIFLEKATRIYRQLGLDRYLVQALTRQSLVQQETYQRNNRQIQNLLMADLENERLHFNLELAASRQKQAEANARWYVTLSILVIGLGIALAYRYYYNQRLKIALMRNRISKDLHDEIGATLSGIVMYSHIANEQVQNRRSNEAMDSLHIIRENAGEIVDQLNDIVWVVKPSQDSFKDLMDRLYNFSLHLCATRNVDVRYTQAEHLEKVTLDMLQRKNLYLIGKEIIHNAFKHSGCRTINITVTVHERSIELMISDDGKGFDVGDVARGNGLDNMEYRAADINAQIVLESQIGKGSLFKIMLQIP